MSEKKLTDDQKKKIEKIKQQWIEEVKPYLSEKNQTQEKRCKLDGDNTWMLAKLQEEYDRKIREVINAT